MSFSHTSVEIDKAYEMFKDTRCRILVTAINDSYVRAISESGVVNATILVPPSSGVTTTEYVIYPNSFGSYEVLSSNGMNVKSSLIYIDRIKDYQIDFTDPNQI